MPKKFTFTRPATTIGLASNKALARDLQRAHERFGGDIVPRSIKDLADQVLADKAMDLRFAAKCSHAEAMHEVLRKEPYLALANHRWWPDSKFGDVEILDEEVRHDA